MTPETITALQALVQADPVLLEQMQNATNLDSAAQLLAQAANQKGVWLIGPLLPHTCKLIEALRCRTKTSNL